MLRRLSRRCDGSHSHQQLVGGRAAQAAFYPEQLVEAILRDVRDTADAEHCEEQSIEDALLVQAMVRAEKLQDTPPSTATRIKDDDLEHKVKNAELQCKYLDGRSVSVPVVWKDGYKDEYTQDFLSLNHIKRGDAR